MVLLYAKGDSNTLSYVNDIRQHSGLIPFSHNKKLSNAAKSHAKYLVRQHKSGHYEKKGYKGFTGKTPAHRVIHAGYPSKMVMENISTNTKNYKASVNILMSAIYHRFVFLTFDKDEIGIGKAINTRSKAPRSVNVYNLGNSALRKACQKSFTLTRGMSYTTNVCKNSKKKIPESYFKKRLSDTKRKSAKIVLYPYPNQTAINPAFYNESPDPLPGYKVSGYPVSVEFNPHYYQKVTLQSFRLFDHKGKEIKKRKILSAKTDRNHKFSALQFAFMPLKRLEYATKYRVEFKAIADRRKIYKKWSFTTKRPKGTLHKITKKKTVIKLKNGQKIILYFEPRSRKDVLKGVSHKGKFIVSYLDANTLEVTIPNKHSRGIYSLKSGGRTVIFK